MEVSIHMLTDGWTQTKATNTSYTFSTTGAALTYTFSTFLTSSTIVLGMFSCITEPRSSICFSLSFQIMDTSLMLDRNL